MTTNANAPVETRHEIAAASAAGYEQPELVIRSITNGFCTIGEPVKASILAHAQSLANLEAARAENAAKDEAMAAFKADVSAYASRVLELGHKDLCTSPYGYPERCSCGFGALVKPSQELIIPPADPVAEALKAAIEAGWPNLVAMHRPAFDHALAELKSRLPLGGAK